MRQLVLGPVLLLVLGRCTARDDHISGAPKTSDEKCILVEEGAREKTVGLGTVQCNNDVRRTVGNETTNAIGEGTVLELDFHTFPSVIGSSSYTFALFYDGNDQSDGLKLQFSFLDKLAHEYSLTRQPSAFFARNLKLKFARLNLRRHSYIRNIYSRRGTHAGVGEDYHLFYRDYEDLDNIWSRVPDTMVNSGTFMKLESHQLPTFPSMFVIFSGSDYNIVNCLDEHEAVDGVKVDETKYDSVRDWLQQELRNNLHYEMEGVGRRRLPFQESDDPNYAITSQLTREKRWRKAYEEGNPMDSIDWEATGRMAAQRNHSLEKDESDRLAFYRVEVDEEGDTFHRYRLKDEVSDRTDAEIMDELGKLLSHYLTWVDSYENLWDEERKRREDERTNYGFYLHQMNTEVKDALFSAFEDLETEGGSFLFQRKHVPDLKRYFEDMLFGFGRSPSSLGRYLWEVVLQTDEFDNDGIEWFERIREYMRVHERVTGNESKQQYQMYFRTLWIKLHATLAEFHANLSRHYISYLADHPEEKLYRYSFTKLDVIDMGDQNNFELLSDYEDIERRYGETRKPYVLSNVKMTVPFNYTLDFLVEVCGFMDVTEKVMESVPVGDNSIESWGGLKHFELPHELFADGREDRDISLQQFVALMQKFDGIYLHDWRLKETCSSLFWSKTPYDPPEQQYFRIPSVIGRYDLFQRLPRSSFSSSWPSLFIGRNGTNSKLHIDNGATGFWMYLVSGRKRWVLYDHSEAPFLYQRLDHSRSFIADVLALNSTMDTVERARIHDYFDAKFPLLNRPSSESVAYEVVQEPGQLIYIPPNTPHAVENLEDIVGLSSNLVPRTGIAKHLHWHMHEEHNFASLEIALRYLKSDGALSLGRTEDPLYTTLGEYTAQ